MGSSGISAVYHGFGLNVGPELIRWEGRFKRLHQKDYKKEKKQKKNKNDKYAKGLSKQDLEEDEERRNMIEKKKKMEGKKKQQREKAKAEKHSALVKKYADNHYQYDADNPNYKKMDDEQKSD